MKINSPNFNPGYLQKVRGKKTILIIITLLAVLLGSFLVFGLMPVVKEKSEVKLNIPSGAGLLGISSSLESHKVIRSALAFEFYTFATGRANALKPGHYKFDSSSSAQEILKILVIGPEREVSVTIPEGLNIKEIDSILSEAEVIEAGSLIAFNQKQAKSLEGHLFPDTYKFFLNSSPEQVVQKFLANFKAKADPLLATDSKKYEKNLIIASIIEKEVPGSADRKIVSGIIVKRMAAGMPLQVDASICYVKPGSCYPVTFLDLKIASPYNTYLNRGLPPTPIGNPGLDAMQAALNPTESQYWYYLSDPKTKTTIFAKTLDEHNRNRVKYLK